MNQTRKPLPSKDAIAEFLAENPTQTAAKDVGRAFGIKGAAKVELKRILREMEAEGTKAPRAKRARVPGELPPVGVLTVAAPDKDGDLFATAMASDDWPEDAVLPRILIVTKPGEPALGAGDRILAKIVAKPGEGHSHTARLIRRIARTQNRVLGIFRKTSEGGRILPVEKGADREWQVAPHDIAAARDGELVEAEAAGPKGRMGLPRARVVARLGDPSAPRAVSLIAIRQHAIPDVFPDAALREAEGAAPVDLGSRTDLRHLPLITIDPSDARDHDDACCAIPNGEGHTLWVAIADVAHYVTPGSALDREARLRGNSTYFPDRVVPMLPEALSGDLCSLHEGVDRPVIAVEIEIDAGGEKLSHRFVRGLMRSPASLHYEEVQTAIDGTPTERVAPHLDGVRYLYDAYAALVKARGRRQPLDLDLPERRIELGEDGKVVSVAFKERLDAHRLIEEFMVLANVCAAETLIAAKVPLLFRVHEEPGEDKLEALREIAQGSGLVLAKGQVLRTEHLNRLLAQAAGTESAELINIATLRSMTQAYYGPDNRGHFGLALRNYAHFTSPIRRYSDLIVHRGLITAHGWGSDGVSVWDIEHLAETGQQISDTERRSMIAERDTTDRYLAAFLSDKVGRTFGGRVSGVARFGLFIKLDGTGADVLVPMRAIGHEYFHFDRDAQTLQGSDTGRLIGMGQRAEVKLMEASATTGGMTAELLSIDDQKLPTPKRGKGRGKPRSVSRKRR